MVSLKTKKISLSSCKGNIPVVCGIPSHRTTNAFRCMTSLCVCNKAQYLANAPYVTWMYRCKSGKYHPWNGSLLTCPRGNQQHGKMESYRCTHRPRCGALYTNGGHYFKYIRVLLEYRKLYESQCISIQMPIDKCQHWWHSLLTHIGVTLHYNDVIMSAMASQITGAPIVCSTNCSEGRSKKTAKLRVTGPCEGNSPMTGGFPAQRTSNAENVSTWSRHHVMRRSLWIQWRIIYLILNQRISPHLKLLARSAVYPKMYTHCSHIFRYGCCLVPVNLSILFRVTSMAEPVKPHWKYG